MPEPKKDAREKRQAHKKESAQSRLNPLDRSGTICYALFFLTGLKLFARLADVF
jgi:hypothetical protein